MHLRLPRGLHYPITVTELLKQPDDNVERYDDDRQVERKFPAKFESSVEGILKKWKIEKDLVITQPEIEVAEIEEPCAHDVQFGGMCANCGRDMTESSYVTNQLDVNRAQINMIHDNLALKVSNDEATKVEEEAKRRLIASKKLTLVVDLDQTVIQATVDPTVAEWQRDPDNPNYDAVKDVRAFQLPDEGANAKKKSTGCWYFIKLRPGLKVFLDNVSKLYELHVYTMATRAYAQNVCNQIDPDRALFGDRILSRDESGDGIAKNLQRLFPVDTRMVVIIDDRGDVWNWNDNLIKVTPYDFFVGIGDINSSFLPKKPKIKTTPKVEAVVGHDLKQDLTEGSTESVPDPKTNGDSSHTASNGVSDVSTGGSVSALQQLVAMGGGDDPNILQAQSSQQDEAVLAQLEDRPLLQKQLQLDAEDAASEAEKPGMNGDSTPSDDSEKHRHNLLQDHDTELCTLERALRRVHTEFFEIHTRQLANAQGGRLAELRGAQSSKLKSLPHANLDLSMVPDIKVIMPAIKKRVLAGVTLVFSGVVPLGTDIQSSDIALWAKSFGARVEEDVSRRTTTHVIAARNRTAKVRQAVRRGKGRIRVVSTQWLLESITQWERLDETPYLLKTDDGEAGKPFPGEVDDDEILSESEEIESAVDTDTERDVPLSTGPALTVDTSSYATDDEDVVPDADAFDNQSPVGGTNEDWAHMHDEMAEFLGSDADDSDSESLTSEKSSRDPGSVRGGTLRKRKRSLESLIGAQLEGSRKKQAVRSTGLSLSQLSESGLPTPEVTAEEEGGGGKDDEDDGDEGEEGEGDGWSDFEGDLEAEMERVGEEDDGEG